MSCCHDVAVEIVRAASAPSAFLDVVATQLIATFGYAYPAWSHDEARRELANSVGLPLSLLATADGRAVGCASLLADDEVDGFTGVGPWLGNLWVEPGFRSQGVGRALVAAVVELAQDAGTDALHLITDDAVAWHAANGWQALHVATVHGHPMTVMRRSVAKRSGLG